MLKWIRLKIKIKCRKLIHLYIKVAIYYKFYFLGCKSSHIIFSYVWEKLKGDKSCKFLFKFVDNNPYQQNYLDYLPYRIASIYDEIGLAISYRPKFLKLPTDEINEILISNQGAIIISIHDGFSYSTKIISDRCDRISILANHPEKVRRNQFKKTGVIKKKVNIIKADKFCLINMTKMLHQKHIICAHIDFKINNDHSTFLSPSLISFALKKNSPLYFANFKITESGSVDAFAKKANLSRDAKQITMDFIQFINTTSGYKRDFKISLPNKLN